MPISIREVSVNITLNKAFSKYKGSFVIFFANSAHTTDVSCLSVISFPENNIDWRFCEDYGFKKNADRIKRQRFGMAGENVGFCM